MLEAPLVIVTKHMQKHTTRSMKVTRLTSSKNGTRRANVALTATTMAMRKTKIKMMRMKITTSTVVNMAKESSDEG